MSIKYDSTRVLASERRNTEDRAEIFESGEALVILVGDGAGGVTGGRSASDALVAAVADEVRRARDLFDARRWLELFHETDRKLADEISGETTGVLVALGVRGLVGVSAGDSEAWIVGATSIDDLTVHQHRARLGSGRVVAVTFARHALNGALVMGTDGLFKYAAAGDIAKILRGIPPQDAASRLLELVRLPSKKLQDDFAVVVARRQPAQVL